MYHTLLERQLRKYLGESKIIDERLDKLMHAISESYSNYERDKELSEHAYIINEQEYQELNISLKNLTNQLEDKVTQRTKDLEDIAQFPLENPNPIFRVSLEGKILFTNPAASSIKIIECEGKRLKPEEFFPKIIYGINENGAIDLISNNIQYIFYYKKIENKNYVNFYGADVTEKNNLREQAQKNFLRLRNFLDSTQDAFYILYNNSPEKNFVSHKWSYYFGFDKLECDDIIAERAKYIIDVPPENHIATIQKLKVGSSLSLKYQIRNKTNGQQYWVSELINKYYDEELKDVVLSGRISDISKEQSFLMQIRETEQRFRSLMESIPVMVWVSNNRDEITYSNQASKSFLGFELEKLKDYKEYLEFIHPDDRNHVMRNWRKYIAKKQSSFTEYRLKDKKGNYHHISEKAVPRFLGDGTFAGYVGAFFDITEEKSFKQKLIIEKQKLELLTNNSPDIILLTNHLGVIEYVSPTAQKLLGYEEKEMIKKNIRKFICKNCEKQLRNTTWMKKIQPGKDKFEYNMVKKNGELMWVESAMTKIKNGSASEYKILMHNRDISLLKKAELSLIEREQKYRGLFENMHLGVMEVDNDEKIQWVNAAFEDLSGYKLKYLKGKNPKELFLLDDDGFKIMNEVSKLRKKKNDNIYEIKFRKNKGQILDVVISGSPIIDIQGNVKGSVGIHWDVTEIRKMEQLIEEEKVSRQKDIMKATLNAEEQQRKILGNELHDGVGHILTYTSLFLQMATHSDNLDPKLFNKAKSKVDEALNEVRRISRNLMPPALVDLGLKEAIIELFNQYSDIEHVDFKFNCKAHELSDLDFDAQRNIYRIVQELVNNTIKHANASLIKLDISRLKTKLVINYHNNGKAFNINKVKMGVGLKSINNRAYFYGGTTNITSVASFGTKFTIDLPLKNLLLSKQ